MIVWILPLIVQTHSVETIAGYEITHWRNLEGGRVVVKDPQGHIVANLFDRGDAFRDKNWKPRDLDGDGDREYLFTTWSAGAHGSCGFYLLSLGSKFRCMLSYWKGNISSENDLQVRDLDGDGKPELVSWYDGFAYVLDAGYSPVYVPMIFALRGGRYVEATTRFRSHLRAKARNALDMLIAAKPHDSASSARVYAVGFLTIKMLLGEEPSGWWVLKEQLPSKQFFDLRSHRNRVCQTLEGRKQRCDYPRGCVTPFYYESDSPVLPWRTEN